MFCLNELSQVTTRSSAASNCLTKCLPSWKSNPQVLCMNATVLSLPIHVLVHAGCSCQCHGRELAEGRPQSIGRCPEADVVIRQLLILKGESKSQSPTFFWVLRGDQWNADLSKTIPSPWVFSSSQWVANLSKLKSFPSHPRMCESWVVLNEMMFSQSWV